jgi:acylphosphatase
MRRVHCIVSGRVQGVWVRGATEERMRALGLAGCVRILPDGSVEAVLEGVESAVSDGVAFLRRGPPSARVTALEVRDEPAKGERDFEVRR